MHSKDFTFWHKLKTWLNNEKPRLFFHEAEIWFCYLGQNIGFEQDGKGKDFLRPVVVIRKFNKMVFWGVPLTSKVKEGIYYHFVEFGPNKKTPRFYHSLGLLIPKDYVIK